MCIGCEKIARDTVHGANVRGVIDLLKTPLRANVDIPNVHLDCAIANLTLAALEMRQQRLEAGEGIPLELTAVVNRAFAAILALVAQMPLTNDPEQCSAIINNWLNDCAELAWNKNKSNAQPGHLS